MKIASVLMTIVFAGVFAHAADSAPAAPATEPAATASAPAAAAPAKEEKMAPKGHGKMMKAKATKGEKAEEKKVEAGH
jgi:hypothetical protein